MQVHQHTMLWHAATTPLASRKPLNGGEKWLCWRLIPHGPCSSFAAGTTALEGLSARNLLRSALGLTATYVHCWLMLAVFAVLATEELDRCWSKSQLISADQDADRALRTQYAAAILIAATGWREGAIAPPICRRRALSLPPSAHRRLLSPPPQQIQQQARPRRLWGASAA
jgi:hypothetical protein